MTNFRYKALGADGKVVVGEVAGLEESDVVRRLQAMGLMPFAVQPAGLNFLAKHLHVTPGGTKPSSQDLSDFTYELGMLIRAGLPLDRALESLVGLTQKKKFAELLGRVLERVRSGSSLSAALAAEGKAFPHVFTSVVSSGEASGTLDASLLNLSGYLARSAALAQTVKSAMIYPAILLAMAGISIVVVVTDVLPQFEPLFKGSHAELPWSTNLMLGLGDVLRAWWWLFGIAAALLTLGVARASKWPPAKRRWHRLLLKVPALRDLIAKFEVARFSRTLGILLSGGVPTPAAFLMASEVIGNTEMLASLKIAHARLKEGAGLSRPIADAAVFPPLAIKLMRVGEETGKLDEMLGRLAELYDRDVQRAVDRLCAILVPVMTIALGAVIGGVIASVLSALMSINDLAL